MYSNSLARRGCEGGSIAHVGGASPYGLCKRERLRARALHTPPAGGIEYVDGGREAPYGTGERVSERARALPQTGGIAYVRVCGGREAAGGAGHAARERLGACQWWPRRLREGEGTGIADGRHSV